MPYADPAKQKAAQRRAYLRKRQRMAEQGLLPAKRERKPKPKPEPKTPKQRSAKVRRPRTKPKPKTRHDKFIDAVIAAEDAGLILKQAKGGIRYRHPVNGDWYAVKDRLDLQFILTELDTEYGWTPG